MPDAKRLPVVRIYISQPAFEFLQRTWGTPEAKDSCLVTEPTGIYTVPFEPAVPNCKTCRWFLLCTHPDGEAVCTLTTTRKKADGSGYCSEHQEARR